VARMTDSEIEKLLRSPEMGVLSTADAEGRPEGTPIWFDWDAGHVRILVHHASRKARNIRENPNVALTVDTRQSPYRGVVLRGTATLSGPDPALRRRLAARYLGEEIGKKYIETTASFDTDDVLVTMRVTSRYSWDYSKGF
jgi:PPOX class probable F420-dependent enzyme